jgi:predicted Fe-Mo cluster-binding NifX family protein
MKRTIAIPLANNKLSAHFGHCEKFAFVEVEEKSIMKMTILDPPEHVPGSYPRWVAAQGATEVIAGGMGQQAVSLFNQQKVNVFVGAPILAPLQIVEEYLAERLTLNANYCDKDDHHHH